MSEIVEFLIDEVYSGERLDKVISAKVETFTRSYAQKIDRK